MRGGGGTERCSACQERRPPRSTPPSRRAAPRVPPSQAPLSRAGGALLPPAPHLTPPPGRAYTPPVRGGPPPAPPRHPAVAVDVCGWHACRAVQRAAGREPTPPAHGGGVASTTRRRGGARARVPPPPRPRWWCDGCAVAGAAACARTCRLHGRLRLVTRSPVAQHSPSALARPPSALCWKPLRPYPVLPGQRLVSHRLSWRRPICPSPPSALCPTPTPRVLLPCSPRSVCSLSPSWGFLLPTL